MMIEDEQWQNLDRPLPKAKAALRRAKAEGTPAVILTARRNHSTLIRRLSALGLEPLVEDLVVVPPGTQGVEKAEALRRLSACGFVGDSELDHVSSTRAQVRFAAVSSGQRSVRYLEARGIFPVYDDVDAATVALLGADDQCH
jgi:phosphoglycolate phosphatase-like HAD superfamily hydrolase